MIVYKVQDEKSHFSFKSKIRQITKTTMPITGKAGSPSATSPGFTGDNKKETTKTTSPIIPIMVKPIMTFIKSHIKYP